MTLRVLMITHNRAAYTRRSLRALCDSMPEGGKVVVWDNASDVETRDVLKPFHNDPNIEEIVYHRVNEKLRAPTNWFWEKYRSADLLGKVDDDCVVPSDWCGVLSRAHDEIPQAGAIACWHFPPEDFEESWARKKIVRYGEHRLMRNCWVCGSGYLMKRPMVEELGLLGNRESFSDYCLRGARAGYIHGWYYPFLYQAHLDDPRWGQAEFQTEADFLNQRPLSAQSFGIGSRREWIARLRSSARMLQRCSFDPADYMSCNARIKRRVFRLFGRRYIPRVRDQRASV